MNSRDLLLVVLFATIGIAYLACDDSVSPTDTTISGYVYYSDLTATEGALVRVIQTGDSAITDHRGRYHLPAPDIDSCTILVSIDDYIPQFQILNLLEDSTPEVSDIFIDSIPCSPRSEFPNGYPIEVLFASNEDFRYVIYESELGDSLYISASESCFPANLQYSEPGISDIWIISSLGDHEYVDEFNITVIPEVLQFGYIIGTASSEYPVKYNGQVELESSGGWVIALYLSYWYDLYMCKSHIILGE